MNPVNWIEMPVKDMPRAKAFYIALLGRELQDMARPGADMRWRRCRWSGTCRTRAAHW